MKIISKFSDSYDGISRLGVDEGMRFYRKLDATEVEISTLPAPIKARMNMRDGLEGKIDSMLTKGREYLIRHDINYRTPSPKVSYLVTGSLITPVILSFPFGTLPENRLIPRRADHVSNSMTGFLQKLVDDGIYTDGLLGVVGKSGSKAANAVDFSWFVNHDESVMGSQMSGDVMKPFRDESVALALGTPLALITYFHGRYWMRERKVTIITNPCLKYLNLYSVITPVMVHQEITMALGGFMTPREEPSQDVSDVHLAASKGFNDKSFRREKGDVKPRKRKRRAKAATATK